MGIRRASLARTEAALRLAQRKIELTAPVAEHASAEIVARNMQARAPVRTGHLRASIHAEGSAAVAETPYAVPVDRGHDNVPADPYAEGGAQASMGGITMTMAAIFRRALGGR